jgi:ABC-type multidrug transport system ATPase subunit
MLTGLTDATAGDATVLGYSLRSDIDAIRKTMGVCPQFDILWNELTSAEHIRLFGALKGLAASAAEQEATERLRDVDLTSVSNIPAGNYSGGMKRRLSVAIALTGSPQIVYLDEPTTGMDPVSRRQVWTLLEKEKKKRLVVLTTHSMEEADMLADNVAIMKKGELCCIGSVLHLKSKFGSGYRMTLVTEDTSEDNAKIIQLVGDALPKAELR